MPKLLLPIHNVWIGNSHGIELQLGNAIIISPGRLKRKWKKFGFPIAYTDFEKKYSAANSPKHILDGNHLITILELTDEEFRDHIYFRSFNELNKIIYIIASSDLGSGTLYSRQLPGSILQRIQEFDFSVSISHQSIKVKKILVGRSQGFKFDPIIMKSKFGRSLHFFKFVQPLFNSKLKLEQSWENDIKQAIVLAGKAVCSKEHWESFNWCFIALERLLKNKNDGHFTAQIQLRLKSLFGEFSHYNAGRWEELIKGLYEKRNDLVHAGNFESVTLEDTIIAESLLANTLQIILANTRIFKSKASLIKFSKEYEARLLLGHKTRRSKSFAYGVPMVSSRKKMIIERRRWY